VALIGINAALNLPTTPLKRDLRSASPPLNRIFDKRTGNALAQLNPRNSTGRAVAVQSVFSALFRIKQKPCQSHQIPRTKRKINKFQSVNLNNHILHPTYLTIFSSSGVILWHLLQGFWRTHKNEPREDNVYWGRWAEWV